MSEAKPVPVPGEAKFFDPSGSHIDFQKCSSQDSSSLATKRNKALKRLDDTTRSSSETDYTYQNLWKHYVEENTEAAKKNVAQQDSANKSRNRKHIINSSPASSSTVMTVNKNRENR